MTESLRFRIAKLIGGEDLARKLSSIDVQVDDSAGWASLTGTDQDRSHGEVLELYQDALDAWRKNPIAWRIVSIISDYVVGDRITVSSPIPELNEFIQRFWNHRKNRMGLRLEAMCDELSRSGDLFVVLFRNGDDGMSYIRFVTKDQIQKIETKAGDWETELVYHQSQTSGEPKRWYSPEHGRAKNTNAIMLHYAVNRPIGALLGESDLVTMIPWLQRYSRMLEDRVRLHWAVRAFLWIVTVPSNKVKAKREQYRRPPEGGSVVVKDGVEEWDVMAPNLRGADAEHDLRSVRQMIDAGSGFPPHWRGEPQDTNLATARAMQAPTERHLARRQRYFLFMLQDILYQAYLRAVQVDRAKPLETNDYNKLFTADMPDVSRRDNQELAGAARDLAAAMGELQSHYQTKTKTFTRLITRMIFKFAGEPLSDDVIDQIMSEIAGGDGLETEE